MKKDGHTRQNEVDRETEEKALGTGADQRGGQDRLDPPRRIYDDGPHQDQPVPNRKSIMGVLRSPYKKED